MSLRKILLTFFLGTVYIFQISAMALKKDESVPNNTNSSSVPGIYSVTIKDQIPQRIVSLSPACTEILCYVGAFNKIAARTDFCNFPPEVKDIPSTGGWSDDLSMETIISFKPDFVYGTKAAQSKLTDQLQTFGINYYLSEANTIDEILAEIEFIGTVTGNGKTASEKVKALKNELSALKSTNSVTKRGTVYIEIWNSPLLSIGKKDFLNEIIESSGGQNIFYDLNESYPIISEESILKLNPEFILVPKENNISPEDIKKRNSWENITAVKQNNIYLIDSDIFCRPGPRFIEAIKTLKEILNKSN